MNADPTPITVIEELALSLRNALQHNPGDMERAAAVLWTDQDAQWEGLVAQFRQLMPQLLTLGDYRPEERKGPAIWLRTVIDSNLAEIELPENSPPVLYLPGVSRQELRTVEDCPDHLKPLVELQYRGVCWTQKNGRDWTLEAFLVSDQGGLGLDVARDSATRHAMLRSLAELASTPVEALRGRRLEAEDFNHLLSEDPVKDLLRWLSDPDGTKAEWKGERWNAFKAECRNRLRFNPDGDGPLVGAELLGKREGQWATVWERFAEAPALYPGLPDRLRAAMPSDLFTNRSSWPQNNERDEDELRQELNAVGTLSASQARETVLELEQKHGSRRDWVWARLGRAPLASALKHLAEVAQGTATALGGASPEEMASSYAEAGWKVDIVALDAVASVKSAADSQAVTASLRAMYKPWLEFGAERLQELVGDSPLPVRADKATDDISVDSGCVILFADGLRLDVSQRLIERIRASGLAATLSTRWAPLPTVTATAKPAVSPAASLAKGDAPGEDFLPVTVDGGQPLTTDRFRKRLAEAGYEYISADETGDPSTRGWTENGDLDHLGHNLEGRLAGEIAGQVELLLERIKALVDAGWSEVRVVTDHGWLWLPGGLPKVSLPNYLVASRWARCAAVRGHSKVAVPTVGWYWNPAHQVALAPGVACFSAGQEYAHGGLSLQEALVPVLSVAAGAASAKAVAKIADVAWAGLRCRVRIESAQPGLSVDLRTKVNDPGASVAEPHSVNADGQTSLLVANEELQGEAATVVVLDASGHVVAKQATIIGGED